MSFKYNKAQEQKEDSTIPEVANTIRNMSWDEMELAERRFACFAAYEFMNGLLNNQDWVTTWVPLQYLPPELKTLELLTRNQVFFLRAQFGRELVKLNAEYERDTERREKRRVRDQKRYHAAKGE